ncbi:condensation domain-containing protein [Dactylosporangium sp. AC04546]|uniref:condensation domain-containing protein n=1 Tax=Dactylosporangium sp. AC04546 TaxID=2862460 RepID=UPI001EE082D9|nr:condensation domain-containing protein [Dactylosporangium sp. AC04546]WVK87949.1 condensation domain-containing protein [Dactylosporangium sp. AC04546]
MDRIDVHFRGAGAGTAELTWGQRAMWQAMERERSWLPMGGRRPVPPGTTLDDVAAELRYTMGRYQSFRTRLRSRPGLQIVADRGSARLDVVDAGDDDPEMIAAAVERDLRASSPDLEAEFPMRMAVVLSSGTPSRLVAIMPHIVTDGIGAAIMVDEVTRRAAAPPEGLQPLDLAAWQASPAGERQHAAARRHWERPTALLSSFGALVGPSRQGIFVSPALAAALPAVSATAGVDSATVLLAAYMTVLGRMTDSATVAVRQVVSNRFRGGLAGVVSPITQLGLCVADVSGSFDDALAAVARASLPAQKHAYYDPFLVGGAARTACLNDRRSVRAVVAGASWEPGTFTWAEPPVGPTEPLFVHVDDEPGALRLTVDVSVPSFDAEACVRDIETLLICVAQRT